MSALRYEAPTSIDAATSLLTENLKIIKVLAGGTDVIVQMHSERIEPELIVDIKNIPELKQIEQTTDGFSFHVSSKKTRGRTKKHTRRSAQLVDSGATVTCCNDINLFDTIDQWNPQAYVRVAEDEKKEFGKAVFTAR